MNRGNLHYFIGMRGYYISIPLFLWIFGGIWLLSGVLVLTAALFFLDQKA